VVQTFRGVGQILFYYMQNVWEWGGWCGISLIYPYLYFYCGPGAEFSLFSSPCQNLWWPYRKGPKHVVYLWTPYTVIKCCVLTHSSDIILIFDIQYLYNKILIIKDIMFYCVWGYMFRSLHDHHQAFLRIKLIDAGYMLGSQLCLQFIQVYFF